MKVVIKVPSKDHMEEIDNALWTYDKESFLPHDTNDSDYKKLQPIYITTENENPANAQVLILTDGATALDFGGYSRVLEMFDGNNPTTVQEARTRWTAYKKDEHDLTYWQQTDRGGWTKKG